MPPPSSFGSTDPSAGRGSVTALDLSTGRRLWTEALASPPFGCTTVARDVVFVPTFDGRIRAYAAADGRVLWQAHGSRRHQRVPVGRGRHAVRRGRRPRSGRFHGLGSS